MVDMNLIMGLLAESCLCMVSPVIKSGSWCILVLSAYVSNPSFVCGLPGAVFGGMKRSICVGCQVVERDLSPSADWALLSVVTLLANSCLFSSRDLCRCFCSFGGCGCCSGEVAGLLGFVALVRDREVGSSKSQSVSSVSIASRSCVVVACGLFATKSKSLCEFRSSGKVIFMSKLSLTDFVSICPYVSSVVMLAKWASITKSAIFLCMLFGMFSSVGAAVVVCGCCWAACAYVWFCVVFCLDSFCCIVALRKGHLAASVR